MDQRMDRRTRPTPQPPRPRVTLWDQLLALLTHASAPQTRTVARAGRQAIRVARWRAELHTHLPVLAELLERSRQALGMIFAVVTLRQGLGDAPESAEARPGTASGELSWHPPVAPRARLIVNPHSGSMRGGDGARALRETAIWLTKRGLPTELVPTEAAGHAGELARECARAGMEMVIAAGGDGTINDVVQGLVGTTTALGVLPMGTMNVWARETGIPLGLSEARRLLLHGARRRVDLGRANSRYFLLMAGVGMDAEVVRRVEGNWLKRWGLKLLDYLLTAGMLGFTQQPARLWRHAEGKRYSTRALLVVIGNTQLHAGTLVFAHRARADDGLLDVVIVGGGDLLHRARVLLAALLRRPSRSPRVRYERWRSLRLESLPPLPVQVDGELIGRLPMTFSVAPAALTVIVPHDAPAHLFSRPAHREREIEPQRSRRTQRGHGEETRGLNAEDTERRRRGRRGKARFHR